MAAAFSTSLIPSLTSESTCSFLWFGRGSCRCNACDISFSRAASACACTTRTNSISRIFVGDDNLIAHKRVLRVQEGGGGCHLLCGQAGLAIRRILLQHRLRRLRIRPNLRHLDLVLILRAGELGEAGGDLRAQELLLLLVLRLMAHDRSG